MASLQGVASRLVRGHMLRHIFVSGITVSGRRAVSAVAHEVLQTGTHVDVLDSNMHYLDTKLGDKTVLFFHGNPTSSFLWRNIIPSVKPLARCLAPDLIGMGKSGKELNNSYTFRDHYKYLSSWIDRMNFKEKLTIVCHEWGSVLGFHWANNHRDQIEALIYMEAIVEPFKSLDFLPDVNRNSIQILRSNAGEELILNKNVYIEKALPRNIMCELTKEEMTSYREPYIEEGESRRPTLTFPRELPIENDGPQYVIDDVNDYSQWLSTSDSIPKLFLDADPGLFSSQIRHVTKDWPNQKSVLVEGMHYVQEDSPEEIGRAINEFLQDVYSKK